MSRHPLAGALWSRSVPCTSTRLCHGRHPGSKHLLLLRMFSLCSCVGVVVAVVCCSPCCWCCVCCDGCCSSPALSPMDPSKSTGSTPMHGSTGTQAIAAPTSPPAASRRTPDLSSHHLNANGPDRLYPHTTSEDGEITDDPQQQQQQQQQRHVATDKITHLQKDVSRATGPIDLVPRRLLRARRKAWEELTDTTDRDGRRGERGWGRGEQEWTGRGVGLGRQGWAPVEATGVRVVAGARAIRAGRCARACVATPGALTPS